MYTGEPPMRASQRRRLEFIDFRLMFLGSIKRQDLVDTFDISEPAATRDISSFREVYLGKTGRGIDLDQVSKSYLAPPDFQPVFEHDSTTVLQILSTGRFPSSESHEQLIKCDLPTALNEVDTDCLGVITRAIHNRRVINIDYRSHSSGFKNRDIVPFALVDNGLRWHIRSYDRNRERFTDFVLARISNPKITDIEPMAHEGPDNDNQWNRFVDLELTPHPNLDNPETTEHEYGMKSGVLNVSVRAAVAGYVLRRWNVDCSTGAGLRYTRRKEGSSGAEIVGAEYHLWLKNKQALYGVENLTLAPGYTDNDEIT